MSVITPPRPSLPDPQQDPEALIEEARRRAQRRRRRIGASVLLAVGLTAAFAHVYWGGQRNSTSRATLPRPTAATISSTTLGGTLAFSARSKQDGVQEVFLLHPDGATTQVTHWPYATGVEGWSPDGSRLIVDRDVPDGGGLRQSLFLVAADGSSVTRLTRGQWSGDAHWSPDGSRVAYDLEGRLVIAGLNRSDEPGRAAIIGRPNSGTGLSWAPDGSRVAFTRTAGTSGKPTTDIYTANAAGTGVTRLTHSDAATCRPGPGPPMGTWCQGYDQLAWSPGGTRIAAIRTTPTSDSKQIVEIVAVPTRAKAIQQPTVLFTGPSSSPSWSPDGSRISFVGPHGIYVMRSDGSDLRRVTALTAYQVNWSPDGSKLAFFANCAIYTVSRDGSDVTRLTSQHRPYSMQCRFVADENGPVWRASRRG